MSAFPLNGRTRYGPGFARERHNDGGNTEVLAEGVELRLRNGRHFGMSRHIAVMRDHVDRLGHVVSEGGTLSGSWTETSRNVSGSVSGRASGGQIQARIDGAGFSASLVVSTEVTGSPSPSRRRVTRSLKSPLRSPEQGEQTSL
jgi:hypothetical protein